MNQEKVGQFIAKCRKEENITQREFAEKLGVTDKTVSRWENGHYLPDISLYKDICQILNISVLSLMEGEKITDDKKILEKVDDVLIKNVEESNKKNKRDMLYIVSTISYLALLFILFTMNAYREFRTVLIILSTIVIGVIFFLTHKTLYKKYLIIPIILVILFFVFDYIAVSNYNVEPILAINTVNETSIQMGITYRKYNGLFYTAYKCTGTDYYEIGNNTELNNYCFKNFYEGYVVKLATIQDINGYIYYMQLNYSGGRDANITVGIAAFNLDNVFDMIEDNPFISDIEEQIKYKNQLRGPIGDCCDNVYVSKDMKKDFDNVINYFNEKKFDGEISLSDLNSLKLINVDKKDIVALYNKVLNSEVNMENLDNGYAMYRETKTVDNVEYQVRYFTLDKKIEYVNIDVKNSKEEVDNSFLRELENDIVSNDGFLLSAINKNDGFLLSAINKNDDYIDLYKFLDSIFNSLKD